MARAIGIFLGLSTIGRAENPAQPARNFVSAADRARAIDTSTRPIPKENLIRFEPSHEKYREGGDDLELKLRVRVGYHGLVLPRLGPRRVYTILRLDLSVASLVDAAPTVRSRPTGTRSVTECR